MAKHMLDKVVRIRPGVFYTAVCHHPNNNNFICGIQFEHSVSMRPIIADEVRKLRSGGPIIHVYEWDPGIKAEWPVVGEGPEVFIMKPGPAPKAVDESPKPKAKRSRKKKADAK